MTDPRWRRAEQLRGRLLRELKAQPIPAHSLWWRVMDNEFPGSTVTGAELLRALQVLRREGRVRYVRPNWELVP
jgi:hypothetical protein